MQGEKQGENKKRSLLRLHFIKRIEYTENKKPPQWTALRRIRERKFFFLAISHYLCNKQSSSLKWQNEVEYRSSLVSLSLPFLIDNQSNL